MKGCFVRRVILGFILEIIPFLSATAATSVNNSYSQISIPTLTPGFEFNVGALYLRPTGTNFDYAILTSPLPVPSPDWAVQSIDPSYTFGFTIGGRYIFPHSGNDAQLNWSHLNTSDSNSVRANSSQFVAPFYEVGPPAGTIRQSHGQGKTTYDVVDLDAGQFVNFGARLQTRLFAGLSWAYLRQELISTYQDNAPTFTVTSDNTSKYTGLGPRFGVLAKYDLCHGFGVVGQVAGSLLVGTQGLDPNTTYTSNSTTLAGLGISVNHQGISASSSTQVVPALDAKLGFNYVHPFANDSIFTVEAGYLAATYINAVIAYNPNSLVTPLQTGTIAVATMGKTQSNFSISGPYLNFSVKI